MFTGIIESLGHIVAIDQKGEDFTLKVNGADLDMSDVKIGDSIAVNGVCLTAIHLQGKVFTADVSVETIRHTSLGNLKTGAAVNLEKALTPTSRLGGHLVSGHVDGLATVLESFSDGRAIRFVIDAPAQLAKYIAAKGSVCIDGISLTVNEVDGTKFMLNIVPHTADQTTASTWRSGVKVNLEVDVIARYLERLLSGGLASEGLASGERHDKESNITEGFLAQHGFLK
jgi:riboflavin synthase